MAGYIPSLRFFYNLLNDSSLEDYYGIPKTIRLHTTPDIEQQKLTLSIIYNSNHFYKIKELPFDINKMIHSYLHNKLEINIQISFPSLYPFRAPTWSLIRTRHNFLTSLSIPDYYKYLINSHNNQYVGNWSPTITMEKDILEFIQKINHFEYLLHH